MRLTIIVYMYVTMATGFMYVLSILYSFIYIYSSTYILNYVHIFRVYFAGSVGPVVLVLHGGGHSALSWALFTVSANALTQSTRHSYKVQPIDMYT